MMTEARRHHVHGPLRPADPPRHPADRRRLNWPLLAVLGSLALFWIAFAALVAWLA